ncbi:MAG: zinc-dependent peptidase [Planctomycetota bacterium]
MHLVPSQQGERRSLRGHDGRAHAPAPSFPTEWSQWLDALPFYGHLEPGQQARLRARTATLVARVRWLGFGLAITDEIRVSIAAQAALLLLGLDLDDYPNVHTIAVHREPFATTADAARPARDSVGEVGADGAVHLVWDAVRRGARDPHDGRNLVFHEFAHALDLLDGRADGCPPLPCGAPAHLHARWMRQWNAALRNLRVDAANDRPTLLDTYGARNLAELFAVATECFFERGDELGHRHPQLYELLWEYYGQDPAAAAD